MGYIMEFSYMCKIKEYKYNNSLIHQYSALEAGLAGTTTQSCDRCGSGTLYPGQVLEGSLPLLFPRLQTFPLSPPLACTSATTREILAAKVGTVGENNNM